MKEKEEYEYADKRICKYGLQIERCSRCLFEALCHYQDNKGSDIAEVEKTS